MPKQGNVFRVAVLSDIHPADDSDDSDSSILKLGADRNPDFHPFEALHRLIKENDLSVDLLLCAGDLGTKSNPKTIEFTWGELQVLAGKLKADKLIATPGNHDHDSRSTHNKYDPKGYLQSLNPKFPYEFNDDNSHFWAWNFDIVEDDFCRIIILNSSAYHGINDEFLHGRVTEVTINKLKEKLLPLEERPINIILCHHHFHKNEDIKISDYDAMHGSDKLLTMLSNDVDGDWMIVHGHKHYPKIYYGNTSSGDAPVIFSAGSFSGDITGTGCVVQNQFYILEFEADDVENFGLVGQFNAWDWASGRGWVPASERSGLPQKGGFGNQTKTKILLKSLLQLPNDTYTGKEVYDEIPHLKYLTPVSLTKLGDESFAKGLFEMFFKSGEIESMTRIKAAI
jgi:hypothetical protein